MAERLAREAIETLVPREQHPPQADEHAHLRLAVAALNIAAASERIARAEVMAAREVEGATWGEIGAALGVSRQTAHERFRTGPDGMHSRLFKQADGPQPKPRESSAAKEGSSKSSASRTAASARS